MRKNNNTCTFRARNLTHSGRVSFGTLVAISSHFLLCCCVYVSCAFWRCLCVWLEMRWWDNSPNDTRYTHRKLIRFMFGIDWMRTPRKQSTINDLISHQMLLRYEFSCRISLARSLFFFACLFHTLRRLRNMTTRLRGISISYIHLAIGLACGTTHSHQKYGLVSKGSTTIFNYRI